MVLPSLMLIKYFASACLLSLFLPICNFILFGIKQTKSCHPSYGPELWNDGVIIIYLEMHQNVRTKKRQQVDIFSSGDSGLKIVASGNIQVFIINMVPACTGVQ